MLYDAIFTSMVASFFMVNVGKDTVRHMDPIMGLKKKKRIFTPNLL